jgi:hypothetical protein
MCVIKVKRLFERSLILAFDEHAMLSIDLVNGLLVQESVLEYSYISIEISVYVVYYIHY